MTVMVTPCLWYVVGMKLVMSYRCILNCLLPNKFKNDFVAQI